MTTVTKKKLIEVALPLDAINKASAKEKSIRHGHPSTLHLWWARRPLAAARAVIFAQMVDDPSSRPDIFPTLRAQEKERNRLFKIIEALVIWENSTNEKVLQAARDEIWRSWRAACAENVDHARAKELFDRKILPAFHDPFAGGGTLPLEAQRLGLEAHASDLNPVAVLIGKAMIDIPARYAGCPPVHAAAPNELKGTKTWRGAQGLAEDVRRYGEWMRSEAEKRIGHHYPQVSVTPSVAKDRPDLKPYVGKKLTVVACLWARTVKSPNPAFASIDVPLASTFMVSTKKGKETYVEPVVGRDGYRFVVKVGKPPNPDATDAGTSAGKWSAFRCLMSGEPITYDYIREEGLAGRMGAKLMAIVAEGKRERVYLPPTPELEAAGRDAEPVWFPELPINYHPRDIKTQIYGLTKYGDLFTRRQLIALNTFCDLVEEARQLAEHDAKAAGLPDDGIRLAQGGRGAAAYGDAVAVYLAFAISKLADRGSTICTWFTDRDSTRNTFARQAIPMTWDFAELNALLDGTGSFVGAAHWTAESLEGTAAGLGAPAGESVQADAATQTLSSGKVISTDPPYYDNIGYADLSDFFYVWLRRSLKGVFPGLFSTMAVPKAEELVATPYRHGSRERAEAFFLEGMTGAMHRLAEAAHPGFPVTIYYAFKQSERDGADGASSTGWETFLDAVIHAGFAVSGTWPMRTELSNRMIGTGSNALASSIVLVCRRRAEGAPSVSRREFLAALKLELPVALAHLQRGNIAPVDLAQAAIGPGMAVYTRYSRVLDADGQALSVREALALINQTLDEALAEQEGDFDPDSRWALAWFEQCGFSEGEYGVAETLSTAKNTSVAGLVEAGILKSGRGKVRLLKASELPSAWDPSTDDRLTVWEVVHHLIRALDSGGELGAATIVAKLGAKAETAREFAYRLYALCERKKRATEAMAYNGLVQSWPEITRLAREGSKAKPGKQQTGLFDKDEE